MEGRQGAGLSAGRPLSTGSEEPSGPGTQIAGADQPGLCQGRSLGLEVGWAAAAGPYLRGWPLPSF